MLTDIALGQYYPGNSLIHKLDPRTKILITLFFIVAIFLASGVEFCVFPRLDSSRGVSDKPQTMSGLSGAPSGTASQTI